MQFVQSLTLNIVKTQICNEMLLYGLENSIQKILEQYIHIQHILVAIGD